jgi:hypothetical protein
VNVRKKEVFSTVYDVSYLAAKQDYSPVHAGAVGGVNNRIGVLGCWGVGMLSNLVCAKLVIWRKALSSGDAFGLLAQDLRGEFRFKI